jgi:hypothetical protein
MIVVAKANSRAGSTKQTARSARQPYVLYAILLLLLVVLEIPTSAVSIAQCGQCVNLTDRKDPGHWGAKTIDYTYTNFCEGNVTLVLQGSDGRETSTNFSRSGEEGHEQTLGCTKDTCPYQKVREICYGSTSRSPGTNASPGEASSQPTSNTGAPDISSSAGDFCSGLQDPEQQVKCSVDCKKDPRTCEQWKRVDEEQVQARLRETDKAKQKKAEQEKLNAKRLAAAKEIHERACAGGAGKCFMNCINRFSNKLDQDGCFATCRSVTDKCSKYEFEPRQVPGAFTQYVPSARPAPSRPAAPQSAPSAPATSDCPPGMVHDPRINPRECIRL